MIVSAPRGGPSRCAGCKRPIAGDATDPKICVDDPADGPVVLCTPCFLVDSRRLVWLSWSPEALRR